MNGQKTSVASLRQPYDMLVLKVLALLQDSDPPLARTIAGSREAIWGILADPEKFNSDSDQLTNDSIEETHLDHTTWASALILSLAGLFADRRRPRKTLRCSRT